MRILLYEPQTSGHRGVVLRYVERSIRSFDGISIRCSEDFESSGESSLVNVLREAERLNVDGIHILTADGCMRKWATDFRYLANFRRPIICTYYLFQNLWSPNSGLAWDTLHWRGLAARVLISDDFLSERRLPHWRNYVRYLPDPWDPAEFSEIEQQQARRRLGLHATSYVALVFGDLSPRKGIDLIISAALRLPKESTITILLAGVVLWDALSPPTVDAIQQLARTGRITLHDGFIREEDVATYFYSADVILCAYPRNFVVSSNTFTRACASGRPTLTASHGNLGRFVREHRLGCTYETGDSRSLAEKLVEMKSSTEWCIANENLRTRLREIASRRTLDHYARSLKSAYEEVFFRVVEKVR
jgi:glycosyltransferase involved in cell wall biosynthesis